MDKKNIVIGIVVLVVFAGLMILGIQGLFKEQRLGGSCGTVSPDSRDGCCERQNKDTPHIMCVGSWKYDAETDKCGFVCETGGQDSGVTDFDGCVEAGYPVMESYPRQCRTPDGRTFTEAVQEPVGGELIGGQRDEHGCLGPAGYSWDVSVGACTRSWEIKEESQKKAAKTAVDYFGQTYGLTVTQVDVLRCPGCFDVYLTNGSGEQKVTLRDWEVVDGEMTIGEAMEIAGNSDCVKDGNLTQDYVYNNYTKTWWINLDTKKNGCLPACVVNAETKTAEVNWRCTGAIPE